jgi:hypothetical protein
LENYLNSAYLVGWPWQSLSNINQLTSGDFLVPGTRSGARYQMNCWLFLWQKKQKVNAYSQRPNQLDTIPNTRCTSLSLHHCAALTISQHRGKRSNPYIEPPLRVRHSLST